jgi:hypothetical protein
MSSSSSISSIVNTKVNEVALSVETQVNYIFYTLALVNENSYKLPYYQHFINVLFVFIVIIILYVIYRDYIFRSAGLKSRCSEIEDTLEINRALEEPFKYNIYIVQKTFSDKILTNYSICIRYDFVNERTFVDFGSQDILNELLFTETVSDDYNISDSSVLSSGFSYFDLGELQQKYIQYTDNNSKLFFVDKAKMTGDNYLYVITGYDNKILTNDEAATKLLKFVKSYGYDNTVNLSPIYNLLYAIDHKKNSVLV